MSIPVPMDELRAAIETRGGSAYLLTVSDDQRPHAVHAAVGWDDRLLATTVGKRSTANAAARPAVSLLYPARVDGDYTLIVDGSAAVDDAAPDQRRVLITPTRAVLHRPAAVPDPSASCGADCVPVLASTPAGARRSGANNR